jgi:hypothetical protein
MWRYPKLTEWGPNVRPTKPLKFPEPISLVMPARETSSKRHRTTKQGGEGGGPCHVWKKGFGRVRQGKWLSPKSSWFLPRGDWAGVYQHRGLGARNRCNSLGAATTERGEGGNSRKAAHRRGGSQARFPSDSWAACGYARLCAAACSYEAPLREGSSLH